jgi:hypothetical protein
MNEIGGFFFLTLLAGFILISHIGATTEGQHAGYVTAIEQHGLIWKTWRVYVKTDPQSSQEDTYCVTDPAVIIELQYAEQYRMPTLINYYSPYLVWKWQCGYESAIVVSATDNSGNLMGSAASVMKNNTDSIKGGTYDGIQLPQ